MQKFRAGLFAAWLALVPVAASADSTINNLGAGAAVQGTDILPAYQGANPATGVTATQLKTFIGGGTVTSVATSCGVSGGPITGTGTVSGNSNPNVHAGANYAFLAGDCGSIVYLNNASPQIPTIAQAGSAGFLKGYFVEACNIGAGTQTITPATSTIGGAATFVLPAGSAAAPKCIGINSDGTNYVLDGTGPVALGALATITPGTGVATALAIDVGSAGAPVVNGGALGTPSGGTGTNITGVPISTGISGLGTGVAGAAATTLSAAGGLTSTIASGTSALGTGAITSATCATVVTTAATNTATTDVVLASFNGDPTAVTGYVPLTAGMLTIIAYPTSGNVNFKVCNNTSGSITPGAITLNWRVVR